MNFQRRKRSRCSSSGRIVFLVLSSKMEQIHTTQDFDAESSTDSVEQAEGLFSRVIDR